MLFFISFDTNLLIMATVGVIKRYNFCQVGQKLERHSHFPGTQEGTRHGHRHNSYHHPDSPVGWRFASVPALQKLGLWTIGHHRYYSGDSVDIGVARQDITPWQHLENPALVAGFFMGWVLVVLGLGIDPYFRVMLIFWFGLTADLLRLRRVTFSRAGVPDHQKVTKRPCSWVEPAPKSRFVVSGLSRTRATRAGANARRIPGSCIYRSRCILNCRSALARDLPGTGSKSGACGVSGTTESPDFATAAR